MTPTFVGCPALDVMKEDIIACAAGTWCQRCEREGQLPRSLVIQTKSLKKAGRP